MARGAAPSDASTLSTCSALTRPDCSASSRHQHGLQSVQAHPHEHLRHHPVATAVAQLALHFLQNGSGMVLKGAPLRSAPGFRSISAM